MRNMILSSFIGVLLAVAFLAACGGAAAPADVESLSRQVSELEASLTSLRTEVSAMQVQLQQVGDDVGECTHVLAPFSRTDMDVYIVGANLHVRNGAGVTGAMNGLGNVIIGYNAPRTFTDAEEDRSGSHMLVLGDMNNYSGYGGIVAGRVNWTSGPYASALGGEGNEASGFAATVSGGGYNRASGDHAAVSGGYDCEAMHNRSTISGGSGWDSEGLTDHRPP